MKINKHIIFLMASAIFIACDSKKPKIESLTSNQIEENANLLGAKSKVNSGNCVKDVCFANVDLEKGNYNGSYFIGENDRFQSIYSSQNYETFYQVYAKASFYKDSANREFIEKIRLRIVNYKGPFDIGFAKDSNFFNEIKYSENTMTIGLKIVVQARSKYDEIVLNVKSKKIKKDLIKRLNVYRILLPMYYSQMSSSRDGAFDSEFYYRSGLGTTKPKRPVPGHYNYPPDSIGGYKMKDLLKGNFNGNIINKLNQSPWVVFGDSGICYTSSIYVK